MNLISLLFVHSFVHLFIHSFIICISRRTLLMGSAGSFILIYFGWRNVFIIQGFVGLLWAWTWLHYSILKYSNNTSSELGKMKTNGDNVPKTSQMDQSTNSGISVPYGLFFKNIGVW